MAETDVFKHSTPSLYDQYMGPLLFEPYARYVAERVGHCDRAGSWKRLRVRESSRAH